LRLRFERGELSEAALEAAQARRGALLEALRAQLCPEREGPLDPAQLLARLLEALGESPAAVVLATLEDLLLEERPQNLPGTGPELRNFRRKLACSLPELFARADFTEALGSLDR